ncbi:MAG TPA: hypothetical protein VIC34_12345 [Croceibacterium sp.]|jgi:hypothetical protein
MKIATIAALAAASGIAATPVPSVAQDKAQVFTPVGQWSVDYGDDYCRLARNFSSGGETLALAFERIAPGPLMRMIVVSDAIKPFRGVLTVGWHFVPSGSERQAFFFMSQTPDGKAYFNLGMVGLEALGDGTAGSAVVRGPLPPIVRRPTKTPPVYVPSPPYDRGKELATAKSLTGFVIDGGLAKAVEVDTGDLAQAIGALQTCADDLAKTWGLDQAQLQAQQTPPIPEGGGVGWLPKETFAPTDFAKLGGGSNQVRLMVDAMGKPTACAIHLATLDPATNAKICKALMASAKFTPAKDANGQAIPSYWVGRPGSLVSPFGAGRKG